MWNRCIVLIVFFMGITGIAQELNATVTVNSERIQQTNKQIFTTLQNSMRDFLNNNKFTSINVRRSEQIDCTVLLVVEEYDPNTNAFKGVLQVQSSRPVFNSGYSSPVFAYRDNHISFNYIEFEPLTYSENSIGSNLTGLLSFYAHLMQGTGDKGWTMGEANNRYALANDLLSTMYSSYRQALYDYHIKGLDLMTSDPDQAKKGMADAINTLANVHKTRPNALATRIFFDAKSDEVVQVFSAGPNYDNAQLIETLTRINPLNGSKWNRM